MIEGITVEVRCHNDRGSPEPPDNYIVEIRIPGVGVFTPGGYAYSSEGKAYSLKLEVERALGLAKDSSGCLLPEPVVEAISRYNKQHLSAKVAAKELKWDSVQKCYFFTRFDMLHGIELDGYIHT